MTQVLQQVLGAEQICALQDAVQANLPPVELEYEHLHAPGVYGRIMKAPAGTVVVGKAHRTDHLCVLLKGRLLVTDENGSVVERAAPAAFVSPAGHKKAALVLEDLEFMNVHPASTTDLAQIEAEVIIPEDEYRQMLVNSRSVVTELTHTLQEAAMKIAVQA